MPVISFFFGGMWYAVAILGVGMTYCVAKTIADTMAGKGSGH